MKMIIDSLTSPIPMKNSVTVTACFEISGYVHTYERTMLAILYSEY